jgi:hypothetical protein
MFSLESVIRASSGALVEDHLHETGQPQMLVPKFAVLQRHCGQWQFSGVAVLGVLVISS